MALIDSLLDELRACGLSQDELAVRAGFSRETVSRWLNGRARPTADALEALVTAAGYQLDVRLLPAEPKLVDQVRETADRGIGPTMLLMELLRERWPACRSALRAAASLGDRVLVVGPTAAALSRSPQRPGHGRVDVLADRADQERIDELLFAAGGEPRGPDVAIDGSRRALWQTEDGQLAVRWTAPGIDRASVFKRARPVMLELGSAGVGVVRLPLVEDLVDLCAASPWSEDRAVLAGLRALLASGRYSSRAQRKVA